jgi:hypothetical protein
MLYLFFHTNMVFHQTAETILVPYIVWNITQYRLRREQFSLYETVTPSINHVE